MTLAAADSELTVAELLAAAAALGLTAADLEPAELAGLIEVTGQAIRFRPPALREVAYHDARLAQRLAAHAVLAGVTPGLRSLVHRAAGAIGPDDDLARSLVTGADEAGHTLAAEAYERAADLFTDPRAATDALVEAARRCWLAGRPARAGRLLHRAGQSRGDVRSRARAAYLRGAIRVREANTAASREDLLGAAQYLLPYDVEGALDALLIAGEAGHLAGEHDRFRTVSRRLLSYRRGDEPLPLDLAFSQVAGLTALLDGDHTTGFAELRRVLTLAGRSDDPAGLIRAATAGLLVGDGPRAAELAARAVVLAGERGENALLPAALEAAAFAGLAAGRYDTATASAVEGVTAARALGRSSPAGSLLPILAVLAAMIGDRDTALLRAREAHAEQPGQERALCEWALALLDLAGGRPRPAAERLLRAIADPPPGLADPVIRVAATPHLIEAAARAGFPSRLGALRSEFDRWADSTGRPDWLALRDRCAALAAGDESAADDLYRTALRRHRSGQDDFGRAHTQLLYGQELRRHRRPGAAREHLRDAAETFRLLGAGPWAVQAEAELRAAGEPAATRPGTGTLTAQQEHIARLVADGATNREVAQRLLLSPRTVDHHLRNIFVRLGVRSRTELSRLLTARDAAADRHRFDPPAATAGS
jgi:DNA-binding CsgD family transcriptional regulator